MTRYLLLTGAILVTIIALMGWALQRSYKANGRIAADLVAQQDANEALQEAAKRDQATLAFREELRGVATLRAASQGHAVEAALVAQPAWAAQPLPSEVLDALR